MPVFSKLENSPREVLEQISVSLVRSSFLGPPTDLVALWLVSKSVWKLIGPEFNTHLYARIFFLKFDAQAAVRRLGDDCAHATELTDELVKRFMGLKRLRAGTYRRVKYASDMRQDEILKQDLWMAYLMLIESDGKNAKQLIDYARVDVFARNFVIPGGRLHDGILENGGWTVDNEVNALAVWLFWFTDKERINSETPVQRQQILQAFAHIFVGSFKYASTHAPITTFLIPPVALPAPPVSALALAACPLSPPSIIPDHFGFEVTLARPLLSPPALLSCVARLEAVNAEMALALPLGIPATRAEAVAMGYQGPTWEDLKESKKVTTKFVEWSECDRMGSQRHEHDWMRLLTCYNPWDHPPMRDRVYTPGMLDGVWSGRRFEVPVDEFSAMLAPAQARQSSVITQLPLVCPVPMQFRLREHHQHEPCDMVDFDDLSCDGAGKGVFNAWLPEGTTMVEMEGGLRVHVLDSTLPFIYRTYNPTAAAQASLDQELAHECEHDGLYGGGVWDIILTGETDETFGEAWGHARFYGRVRDWDGLVVLVREAAAEEGRWIFRGYVHGKQNLVGRWRETGTPVDLPGWEGVWCMTKKERK